MRNHQTRERPLFGEKEDFFLEINKQGLNHPPILAQYFGKFFQHPYFPKDQIIIIHI